MGVWEGQWSRRSPIMVQIPTSFKEKEALRRQKQEGVTRVPKGEGGEANLPRVANKVTKDHGPLPPC